MQSVRTEQLLERIRLAQPTQNHRLLEHTDAKTMHNIGFILEQGLGHRTHTLNLQSNVDKDQSVHAIWQLIENKKDDMFSRVPLYRRYWTLEAGLRTRWHIAKMQQRINLDALFFHTQVMAVLATKWMKQIPSVISLDATPLQYDELGEYYAHVRDARWLEDQKWRLNRNCFHYARHLVTWSAWAKEGLINDYEVPTEKVTIIPPGINLHEWETPKPRIQQGDPVKILFVGGNLKRKGGDDLVAAFHCLREEVNRGSLSAQPMELHVVTQDSLPQQDGLFVYRDMEPNSPALKRLFQTTDIFCLPTYADCLPVSLIEASAAGLPSVATTVGGIAEIVRHEKSGFLFSVGDRAALVAHLRTLVTNPTLRLRQGAVAEEIVRRHFDAEQNTTQLLRVIKKAITQPEIGSR